MVCQGTLKTKATFIGEGIHFGQTTKMVVHPAPPGYGIKFLRTDAEGAKPVRVSPCAIKSHTFSTTIGNGAFVVSTVEHLMSAFYPMGIDNALVELDGPEVPIFDGSAAPFIYMMSGIGVRQFKKPRQFLTIKKPVEVYDEDRFIIAYPSDKLTVSYTIEFASDVVKRQTMELVITPENYSREIARARTFGFLADMDLLKKNGFAKGGTLNSAIVVNGHTILNRDGLRYPDEFVRHKILDLVGDIALLGYPLLAKIVVFKGGHGLHHQLVRAIASKRGVKELVSF